MTSAQAVSADQPYEPRYAEVLGHPMAYLEHGSGDPVVLLHGNPTSSYLWRNVMPHLEGLGRLIAPDLIGMGRSAKVAGSGYRFVDHRAYLDALLAALGVETAVTFVLHDWGSALGFDWSRRHPAAVIGLAYTEAIVCPVSWADWPASARPIFQAFRGESGEELILEKNSFVERVLPASTLHGIGEEAMAVYRAPFAEPGEGRRPTLSWPREIPIEGEPADVHEIVAAYSAWLATPSAPPKLFVNAEPGSILTGRPRQVARSWPNQREVTVPGVHFVQEDSPVELGRAVADWRRELVSAG